MVLYYFSSWAGKGVIWGERNQKKMMMMMADGRKEILRRAILKYSTAYCYLIDRWGYPAKMGAFWRPADCPWPLKIRGNHGQPITVWGRAI